MLSVAAIAVLIYVGLCAALFMFQRSLIYYPQPRSAPAGTDTLTLPVDQARVLVTTRPHAGPDAVIYFGGNAEDVSHSLPNLDDAFPDRALYLLHYRGYGGSTGKPSEAALVADALALFDRVRAEHHHIVVIGRTSVAGSQFKSRVCARWNASSLSRPITACRRSRQTSSRSYPCAGFYWINSNPGGTRYAAHVTAPSMLIAAENDEVIPRASTESLYKHFPSAVAMLTIVRGAGHNTI